MTYQKILGFLEENYKGWDKIQKVFIAALIEKVIKANLKENLGFNRQVEELKPGILYHKSTNSYAKYEGFLISGMLSYKEKINKLYNNIERRNKK